MKKARPAKDAIKGARKVTSAGSGAGARGVNGSDLTTTINRLFTEEKWRKARAILEEEIARQPESHWLRARLSTTYYEERDYLRALAEIKKAYRRAPDCPLVLWDYAGTLDALGRTSQAIRIYNRLLGKGVHSVAHEECGEGIPWAMALVTDCYFRLGICYAKRGDTVSAAKHLIAYVILRGASHAKSIYTVEEALERLRKLPPVSPQQLEDLAQRLVLS